MPPPPNLTQPTATAVPPPPIDWARMPAELISTVPIEPLLRTVILLPEPPAPPLPPTACAEPPKAVVEVALAKPPAPPPPPTDCAAMPAMPAGLHGGVVPPSQAAAVAEPIVSLPLLVMAMAPPLPPKPPML